MRVDCRFGGGLHSVGDPSRRRARCVCAWTDNRVEHNVQYRTCDSDAPTRFSGPDGTPAPGKTASAPPLRVAGTPDLTPLPRLLSSYRETACRMRVRPTGPSRFPKRVLVPNEHQRRFWKSHTKGEVTRRLRAAGLWDTFVDYREYVALPAVKTEHPDLDDFQCRRIARKAALYAFSGLLGVPIGPSVTARVRDVVEAQASEAPGG